MDPKDRAVFGLWFGLLAVTGVLAAFLGFPNATGQPIADVLTSETAAEVPEGYDVEFSGRDGYLWAPEQQSKADVESAAADIAAVRGVRDVEVMDEGSSAGPTTTDTAAMDSLDPAMFELTWDDTKRTGSGVLPADDEPRLAAALGFDGFTRSVDHSLSPNARNAAIELGDFIGQDLRRGRMIVSDDLVQVTAEAVDEDALNRVNSAFSGRDEVELQLSLADPSLASFSVEFDPDDATMTGAAPPVLTQDLERLGVVQPDTDKDLLASTGLQDAFAVIGSGVVRGDLVRGSAVVVDGELSFVGEASSERAKAAMESGLSGLGVIEIELSSEAVADQVQSELDQVLASLGRIEFVSGTAEPTAATEGLLDELAEVLIRHPEVDVEVAGYTDSLGDPETNVALSQSRADAVVAALELRGVDGARLSAVGYGDADPIADNQTSDGRQMNRRVEIKVKEGL